MKDISQMPRELRQAFGDYENQIVDSACGEPIGWGHSLHVRLSEQQWKQALEFGELVFTGSLGSYVLITKWLTAAEALEKYGKVTDLRLGPRGGFKGVTYGKTSFLTIRMDPRR